MGVETMGCEWYSSTLDFKAFISQAARRCGGPVQGNKEKGHIPEFQCIPCEGSRMFGENSAAYVEALRRFLNGVESHSWEVQRNLKRSHKGCCYEQEIIRLHMQEFHV